METDSVNRHIGKKIRDLRNQKGLTQQELADRTELTKGYISQLEHGLAAPSVLTLLDLIECLGTTPSEFFAENEPEQVVFSENGFFEKFDDEGNHIQWIVPTAQKNMMEPLLVVIQPHSRLEDATYIHFLINPTEMRLLIRAVNEGARDAIRWCVLKGDKRKSRQISCRLFTTKLYEMMGWDPLYRYKMQGMKINYEGEDMYLFDLKAVECFLPQKRDPKTGKIPRPQAVLPEEWDNSYGMSVDEHMASTQVDLENGYTDAVVDSPDSPMPPEAEEARQYETEEQT